MIRLTDYADRAKGEWPDAETDLPWYAGYLCWELTVLYPTPQHPVNDWRGERHPVNNWRRGITLGAMSVTGGKVKDFIISFILNKDKTSEGFLVQGLLQLNNHLITLQFRSSCFFKLHDKTLIYCYIWDNFFVWVYGLKQTVKYSYKWGKNCRNLYTSASNKCYWIFVTELKTKTLSHSVCVWVGC